MALVTSRCYCKTVFMLKHSISGSTGSFSSAILPKIKINLQLRPGSNSQLSWYGKVFLVQNT